MSNRAGSGRCFRSNRTTARRKLRQGKSYDAHPVRWKVPLALRSFLFGASNQLRARYDDFAKAIMNYTKHQQLTGKGTPVRAAEPGGIF